MKKLIRNIVLFLVVIMFLVFVCIYLYSQITYSTKFSQNWENMKDDFELINDLAIDYFEKNKTNKIDIYEFKKNLNNDEIVAFERAENNYKRYGDYGGEIANIVCYNGVIEYYDWEKYGQFEKIIYSKLSKRKLKKLYNKNGRHYVIESLGDNWYYLDEHHI